jgi:hypothetical protein
MTEADNQQGQLESPEEIELRQLVAAREVCINIKRVLNGFRTYETGHEILEGFHTAVIEQFRAYFALAEDLRMDISALAIRRDGQVLLESETKEDAVAHPLFLDGVQRIYVENEVKDEEIRMLVDLWWDAVEAPAISDESFVTKFWESEFEHIRVATVETFSEGEEAEEGDRTENQLNAMMSKLSSEKLAGGSNTDAAEVQLLTVTKDDLAVLDVAGVRQLTAEDLARQDSAERARLATLNEEEAYGLNMEMGKASEKVFERAFYDLLRIFSASDEEEGKDLEKIMRATFMALASAELYADLVAMLGRAVAFTREVPTEVQSRAMVLQRALHALEDPPLVKHLVSALDHETHGATAATAMRYLRPGAAGMVLSALPEAKTELGRLAAVQVLKSKNPTPDLFGDRVGELDGDSALSLVHLQEGLSADASKALVESLLRHGDGRVRAAGLKLIKTEEAEAYAQFIQDLMLDTQGDVRRLALNLIGRAKIQSAVPRLATVISSSKPDEQERRTLMTALGMLGGDAAVKVLQKELEKEKDVDLKCACILALAAAGGASVAEEIKSMGGGLLTNKKIKETCKEALRRIEKQPA